MHVDDRIGALSRRVALLGALGAIPAAVPVVTGHAASDRTPERTPDRTPDGALDAAAHRSDLGVDPAAHRSDVGVDRLQDLIDGLDVDAVAVITRDWTLTTPLVLARPVTLRFDGGALRTAKDIDLVLVRSSGVHVVDAVLRGSGAGHSGLGRGVRVIGSVAEPLTDVHVVRADIAEFPHDGVLLEHCRSFSVSGCRITDVGYAGVLMFSCVDGRVTANRIARVVQPAPYPNSYGIEAVRATSGGVDEAPRSSRILIADNHVSDVPLWEGIDTHGGTGISVVRNLVENCRVGIAIVPSKDEADAQATKYAPLDCAVIDNVITKDDPGPGSGIVVRGAGETVGSPAERATAVVLRNTVIGYGDGDRDASILVYLSRQVVLAHNECRGGVRRGISLYHSNDAITLIGNRVGGLSAQGTATSVAIDVRATANTAVLLGNRYRSDGQGSAVYGVLCRQAGNDLVLLANDWLGTTTAVVASTGTVVRYRED